MGEDGWVAVPIQEIPECAWEGSAMQQASIGACGGLPMEATVAVALPRPSAVTCRVWD